MFLWPPVSVPCFRFHFLFILCCPQGYKERNRKDESIVNILARKINTELDLIRVSHVKTNKAIFLPYLAFKIPHHSGSGFLLLKYTKKLEEIQRTATKLKSLANKEGLRGWVNLMYKKSKKQQQKKKQWVYKRSRKDSKLKTIFQSEQGIKCDTLKFLLVGSIVTKENTQWHVQYPVSFECKKTPV